MPFFPNSEAGLSYLAIMLGAMAVAYIWGGHKTKSLAAVAFVNWIFVRLIVSGFITWEWMPQSLPAVTAVSFAVAWRSPWGFACASFTALMVIAEQVSWFVTDSYKSTAIVEDVLGGLVLLVISASAFHDRSHTGINRNDGVIRRAIIFRALASWRQALARSLLSR